MREVWKSVLAFLKNTIPEEVFVPWFGKVEFTEDSEPLFPIVNSSRRSMKKILRKKPPKSAAVR